MNRQTKRRKSLYSQPQDIVSFLVDPHALNKSKKYIIDNHGHSETSTVSITSVVDGKSITLFWFLGKVFYFYFLIRFPYFIKYRLCLSKRKWYTIKLWIRAFQTFADYLFCVRLSLDVHSFCFNNAAIRFFSTIDIEQITITVHFFSHEILKILFCLLTYCIALDVIQFLF